MAKDKSSQKTDPLIIKKARRRVAPKPPSPFSSDEEELRAMAVVEATNTTQDKPKRTRGPGKRPIIPWPKFPTKEQAALYEAVVSEAIIALSELTRSIEETPTTDPLAGIRASARVMKVTTLVAAWGRVVDTTTVIGDCGPDWKPALVRKLAMEALMLLPIAHDDQAVVD